MKKYTIVYKVLLKNTLKNTENIPFLYYGVAYIEAASTEFAEAKFVCSFHKKFSIIIENIIRMR